MKRETLIKEIEKSNWQKVLNSVKKKIPRAPKGFSRRCKVCP